MYLIIGHSFSLSLFCKAFTHPHLLNNVPQQANISYIPGETQRLSPSLHQPVAGEVPGWEEGHGEEGCEKGSLGNTPVSLKHGQTLGIVHKKQCSQLPLKSLATD